MLNAARKMLMYEPRNPASKRIGTPPLKNSSGAKSRAMTMFVRGPASEMIPFSLVLIPYPSM